MKDLIVNKIKNTAKENDKIFIIYMYSSIKIFSMVENDNVCKNATFNWRGLIVNLILIN